MKKNIIITLIINILIIGSLYIYLNITTQNTDGYKIIASYHEDYIPGRTHEIGVDKNLNVIYKMQQHCSTAECIKGIYYPEPEIKKINLIIFSVISILIVIIINYIKSKIGKK